jgi:hypothetical protein
MISKMLLLMHLDLKMISSRQINMMLEDCTNLSA